MPDQIDPVIENTIKHLQATRAALTARIGTHEAQLKADKKELAKVEQALAALRPLGPQSFMDKMTPAVAGALGALAVAAVAAQSPEFQLPEWPTAMRLILEVVHEGGQMTDVEILDAMRAKGWKTQSTQPLNLIRSYISRFVTGGQLARVGESTYQLALPQTAHT